MIKYRAKFYGGALRRKEVLVSYVQVIMDMYEGVNMSVRTFGGVINEFLVDIGLHRDMLLVLFYLLV